MFVFDLLILFFILLFRITPAGFEWGKTQVNQTAQNYSGYNDSFYQRAQLLLSDFFLGSFLVPSTGSWNLNFTGVKFSASMQYSLKVDNPLEFYDSLHRPSHFLNFTNLQTTEDSVDKEDVFA